MARKKKYARGEHPRSWFTPCTPQTIAFKTKRGKEVEFVGRPGGQTSHGGKCPVKKSTAGEKRAQNALSKASKSCKGKHGKTFQTCVSKKLA